MKKIIYIIGFILLNSNIFAQNDSIVIDSTETNQIIFDSAANQDILVGFCNKEGLRNFPEITESYNKEYENYETYTEFLNQYRDSLLKFDIIIVMGTWCSDSRREVPRFYKIMDELSIPEDNITLICVDRSKKAGNIDLEDYYVELVPTFIFMKGNIEVGRIIEAPSETLESDIGQLISL